MHFLSVFKIFKSFKGILKRDNFWKKTLKSMEPYGPNIEMII